MAPWSGLEVLRLDTLLFCLRKKAKSRVENSIAVVGVTEALLIGNPFLNVILLKITSKCFQVYCLVIPNLNTVNNKKLLAFSGGFLFCMSLFRFDHLLEFYWMGVIGTELWINSGQAVVLMRLFLGWLQMLQATQSFMQSVQVRRDTTRRDQVQWVQVTPSMTLQPWLHSQTWIRKRG